MIIRKIIAGILASAMMFSNLVIVVHSDTNLRVPNKETVQEIIVEETFSTEAEETIEQQPVVEFQYFEYQPGLSKETILNEITKMEEYLIYLSQFDIEYSIYESQERMVKFATYFYQKDIEYYENWEKKSIEYPEATKVWLYMKNEFGWSDEVCAGIMGNIMAEVGGGAPAGALAFGEKWKIDRASGMGMFQWTDNRRKEAKSIYGDSLTIEQQLQFMHDELYGIDGATKQVSDSERTKILEGTSPESIAYSFAVYFERCDPAYRSARKSYARFAYNYFTK